MSAECAAQSIPAGYKQTEVGVIPEDWEIAPLGEVVAKFVHGGTPSTKHEDYWKGDIPWITGADILDQRVSEIRRFITTDAVKNSSTNVVNKGNLLLVSRTGVGKLAIALCDIAISQDFTGICTKSERLSTEYLFRFLDMNQAILKNQNQGTSILGITRDTLSSLTILFPPTLAEQQAIAQALTNADALIESLEQLIAKKRQIKQGAMQELLRPKEGWVSCSLPEICWFQEGPGVRRYQFTTSGVKLFNGTNIEKGKIDLDKTDRYISASEAFGPYAHFMADAGDIVIACSGITIDKFDEKVAVLEEKHVPLCMNTSTMRFKVKSDKVNKNYFQHFLRSNFFKEQIGGKATGSAQLNFGPSHVNVVTIELSPLSEQKSIADILSDMDSEIAALEEKLEKSRRVKQGMMQELLTGRIRLV